MPRGPLSRCLPGLRNPCPPYLYDLQEPLLRGGVCGLQDPPDVLGLVQGHLQQVAHHHQLLELDLGLGRQLQHRGLQAAGDQRGLPGLLPVGAQVWGGERTVDIQIY